MHILTNNQDSKSQRQIRERRAAKVPESGTKITVLVGLLAEIRSFSGMFYCHARDVISTCMNFEFVL